MEYDEMATLMSLSKNMTDEQKQNFLIIYKNKRRDQQLMLILTLLGFLGIAGIQRMIAGDILLGIIYFFTVGICFVGTIIDLINIKNLTSKYNQKQAYDAANLATAIFR